MPNEENRQLTSEPSDRSQAGGATGRSRPFIGSFRRFGQDGPAYQVLGVVNPEGDLSTGDSGHFDKLPSGAPPIMAKIRILDSGEETEYKVASAEADPIEG